MCMSRRCIASVLGGLLVLLAAMSSGTPAQAATLSFSNITHNGNPDIGNQLSVDVTADPGGVRFTFNNSGLTPSSITAVYFDLPASGFGGLTVFDSPPSVVFTGGGAANFPGGNSLSPQFMTNLSATADAGPGGVPAHGVNLGESLAIVIALTAGNLDSVVGALLAGALRIGLHVQAIAGGGSDSYLSQTPLPGALPLFASGLAGLGFFRWFKRRRLIAT